MYSGISSYISVGGMEREKVELLTEFILQSDRIERIRDDRALLEEQILADKFDGHVGAILRLEKLSSMKDIFLDAEHLKKVQKLITAEQEKKDTNLRLESKYIGEYRDVPVTIFGRECVPPDEIEFSMSVLMDRIRFFQSNWKKFSEMYVIAEIAHFYFAFERIHPFRDGNGRTGRAMIFYLMRYVGRDPFIFREEDMYLHHFTSLQTGNSNMMVRYFLDKSGLMS